MSAGPRARARYPVDRGRLLRALRLRVEDLGDGRYRVSGGQGVHEVSIRAAPWSCDCYDRTVKGKRFCKHVMATHLFRRLAPPVLAALREITAGLK